MNITESQKIIDKEIEAIVDTIYENRDNDSFYHKGTFNTKDMPNHDEYKYFPNIDPGFQDVIFRKLNTIRVSCIYWFELESIEKATEFNQLLNLYRANAFRKLPATNNNTNSKVLYLGKREGGARKDGLTNIEGRMNQHLGYYEKPTTQGLQLYEYAKDKDFNVTIKVVELEGMKADCLNLIEKRLAKKIFPLCGRH